MGISGNFTIVKVCFNSPSFVFEGYGKITLEMITCLEEELNNHSDDFLERVRSYVNQHIRVGNISKTQNVDNVSLVTLRIFFIEGEEQQGTGYGDILTIPGYYDYEIIGIDFYHSKQK